MIEHDWFGAYRGGWDQEIVPEAYGHPAKFARGLIRRIYKHAIEQGYLREGDTVIDPFAGVALGGLDAMFHGLHWVGVELEEKFVSLGQGYDCGGKVASEPDGKLIGARCGLMIDHDPHHVEGNIDLWNRRYGNGKLPRWGTAVILQGDSRNLVKVLEGARAEGIISSPPWEKSLDRGNVPKKARVKQAHDMGLSADKVSPIDMENIGLRTQPDYGTDPAQLGNMPTGEPPQCILSSPPYTTQTVNDRCGIDPDKFTGNPPGPHSQALTMANYGDSDGQLGAMPTGEPPQAVIGSPPHGTSMVTTDGGYDDEKLEQAKREGKTAQRATWGTNKGSASQIGYGTSDGQLAALPEGEPPAGIVSSPPWEKYHNIVPVEAHSRQVTSERVKSVIRYGESEDQLGNITGDTFWSAARAILLQCHQVLAPGGVAIWVVKDFVRNKKRVDFTGQWRALCESCGFETAEVIKAWLVEERGTQYDLMGEAHTKQVERKSFFRRLYEFKVRAAKFWESVTRDNKAGYLWHAHGELWQDYHRRMLDDTRESPPPLPTRTRILNAAQALAYREAGEPDVEIDTQIDYEVVLVMRKGEGGLMF